LVDVHFGFEHAYGSTYSLWGSTARLHVDRAFIPPASWQPVVQLTGQDHAESLTLPAADQYAGTIESFAEAVLSGRTARDPDEAALCAQAVRCLELVEEIQQRALRIPTTPR
jgi:hypothetical protein